ncbi:hypothetical protein KIN20_021201 [Parelaphostrongylus tenuis]|uniref:Uncharacterized protein n=1 Tax=Parelaphostrongylus tenuis TaxID=148309 RepID=A0AAD5N6U6_PARTN|nr:hypothetical protein KIN20_021201 [Parelaphostrongylus tenuis]
MPQLLRTQICDVMSKYTWKKCPRAHTAKAHLATSLSLQRKGDIKAKKNLPGARGNDELIE